MNAERGLKSGAVAANKVKWKRRKQPRAAAILVKDIQLRLVLDVRVIGLANPIISSYQFAILLFAPTRPNFLNWYRRSAVGGQQ